MFDELSQTFGEEKIGFGLYKQTECGILSRISSRGGK